jgi:pimeloyl-ACP methyl ester carboxylesterase
MEITVDGRRAFAATGGKPFDPAKPALLFLHGAGMDHTVWSMQARYFAHHGHAVLSLDLPGHGRSEGPPPETIEGYAAWVVSLLDAAGAGPVRLVGHSMGSLVALAAAAALGERAVGLAMLGVVPEMKVHPDLLAAARSGNHASIEQMVGWGVGKRAQIGGFRAPGTWIAGASLRLLEAGDYAVLANDLAACDAWSGALEAAGRVPCPALVLSGTDDRMTPPKASRPLLDALAKGTSATLPGAGHMMMIEQPDETLDALIRFLGDTA